MRLAKRLKSAFRGVLEGLGFFGFNQAGQVMTITDLVRANGFLTCLDVGDGFDFLIVFDNNGDEVRHGKFLLKIGTMRQGKVSGKN
jgi:hypothetical protein